MYSFLSEESDLPLLLTICGTLGKSLEIFISHITALCLLISAMTQFSVTYQFLDLSIRIKR